MTGARGSALVLMVWLGAGVWAAGCGGPDYPETWEPRAIWVPYGLKGGDEAPVLNEPDHDGDGVLNVLDRCPDLPEDLDGFRDDDGCPDVDHDGNGVPDAKE